MVPEYIEKEFNREAKAGELVNYYTHLAEERYDSYGSEAYTNQVIWFDSLADMAECCRENWNSGAWNDKGFEGNDKGAGRDMGWEDYNWTFGKDYLDLKTSEEAILFGKVKNKDVESVAGVLEELYLKNPELRELENRACKAKRKRRFSESDGELNIDRYMSGDSAMWEQMSSRPEKTAVKILFNGVLDAGANSEHFMKTTVKMAAFLDILNAAGVSSEVWYCTAVYGANEGIKQSIVACKIKSANEPLDIQKMLSAGVSAVLRYYTFRVLANIPAGKLHASVGAPVSVEYLKWFKEKYEFDALVSAEMNEQTLFKILIDKTKELI